MSSIATVPTVYAGLPKILGSTGAALVRTVSEWVFSAGVDEVSSTTHQAQGSPGFSMGGSDPETPVFQVDNAGYHLPVLYREVLAGLQPGPGKVILDGTLGGGGHTGLLLQTGADVISLDQDDEAIAFAGERLKSFGDSLRIVKSNFRHFPQVLQNLGVSRVDGLLVDLGVSSHQLDEAARGFSFQKNGPLDMRMNPVEGRSAADWVNEEPEEELARVFWEYGEVKASRRLARALVQRRTSLPFETTGDLAAVMASVLPRHGKTHPATQPFQALRIAVNDELGALEQFLAEAPQWLNPGGRIAVISFHSLEDRLVKRAFHNYAAEWLDRPEWPEPRKNPAYCLKLLSRKPVEATEEEIKLNPRSRSARLRVAERISP